MCVIADVRLQGRMGENASLRNNHFLKMKVVSDQCMILLFMISK
jgi:hypothetical protein